MTQDDVRTRIREFLTPHLNGRPLDDTDDIFALGYVNSLFAMQLVLFLEKSFGIALKPEQMDFDNFRTVDGLVRLVTSSVALSA
ncbi:acyl carrier protein [Streptomyces cyaneofuscatus]|uniref:acyl carrier protein n=1 Tax=Streptomyces cyaneofuscatus TaxID=66883 RepID=UPI0037BA09BD